jgi:hypothetical protein
MFGDQVEVVANFAPRGFPYHGAVVPARGVLVRWRDSGRVSTYVPRPE